MIYFTEAELDALLLEDNYRGDLTSRALQLHDQPACMRYRHKNGGVIAGNDIARQLLQKLGLHITTCLPDGTETAAGETILAACGSAARVQQGWKVAQLVLEWCCGVAQYTATMRRNAQAINPRAIIACTRKSIPGTRKLATVAVLAGGGSIHRQGLSESILLFANHRHLCPVPEDWGALIARLRAAAPEHTITVEADEPAQVAPILAARPDIIQLDKFPLSAVEKAQALIRQADNGVRLSVAGGINQDNIAAYAATGVELFITSAPYYAAPQDIKVEITPNP